MHGELPKQVLTQRSRSKRRYYALGLLLILAASGLVYYFASPAQQQQQQRRGRFADGGGAVPVLAEIATNANVPVYLDAVGTIRALNTVTVRPQVDGKLIEVAFKEGQDVKRGDVLARIDPTTYKAQLDQALAKKAQDEALLANARNDLARYEQLLASNAINRQQSDTQRSLVAQYAAQVQADQAAIDSAQATLAYTTIRAPINGRTGIRQVDEGNIVRGSDANGIVVITEVQPISAFFNLPQQELGAVNTAFAKGPLAVEALRSDNGAVVDRGTLRVVDNQVDSSTGTVRLKAEFPNANLQLWPGQFVNIRLLIDTLQQALVIPTGAVQRGPTGTFVYVIGDDNTATVRPVAVQRQTETQTVIRSGIAPGERVVTTGFARLTDKSRVTVSDPAATPPAAATPAANPGPRRPRGDGSKRPPAAPP
ncbi:MAG: efflux RND transporter periplasmic adaptor subunit [Pseudolabrys sp.]|nr:efflux RND transporter periplasmic adaptor subunit [Pseudolabrys sp.]